MAGFTHLMHFKARNENGDPDLQICEHIKSLDKPVIIHAVISPSREIRVIYYEPSHEDNKIPQPVKGFEKELRNIQTGKKPRVSKRHSLKNKTVEKTMNLNSEVKS